MTEGETQQVHVTTDPVGGASCTLANGRGQWNVVTPGVVVVEKSESVLKARCSKDGWKDATGYLTSKVPGFAQAGMMMPYVGILSAAVDASTGAASKYPDEFKILMKPLPATPAIAAATSVAAPAAVPQASSPSTKSAGGTP